MSSRWKSPGLQPERAGSVRKANSPCSRYEHLLSKASPFGIDFLASQAQLSQMQNFKRLVVLMTVEELAAVDDFRFRNRLNNRSDAVRALLKSALAQIGYGPAKAE